MFTMSDLEPYFDVAILQINNVTFKLIKHESIAGDLAVWCCGEYQILATPYFDNVPIPVEVHKVEGTECKTIGTDSYPVEIDSFESYCKKVRTLAEKIIRRANT